jgi:uncharacterized protein YecT (DUF1311 family)
MLDELEGWCAQAKNASSIVICSDDELRRQAIARNKLFEAARGKLSPEAYKALSEDQSRWVKVYTARCGISIDDPPPSVPIRQSVIDCYRRESESRTAYLAQRLSQPNPVTSLPPASLRPTPLPSETDVLKPPADLSPPPSTDREIANDALVRAGMPRPIVGAASAWDACTESAVNTFVDQPEPARTVAEAAMATCVWEKANYMLAAGIHDPASVEDAWIPHLIARVMAIRAARAKLQQEVPKASPAINRNRM